MPRSFDFGGLAASARSANWREPRTVVRIGLGLLLLLNVMAACFAFHLFGRSPSDLTSELISTQGALSAERASLLRTRQIVGKVAKARGEGDQFLTSYMTPRRTTYSTVVAELQQDAETAGLTWKEGSIAPLEPVKGSEDLSMMTVTAGFEGVYPNLLKFINLLDRSQRFLIIDQLAASPQPSGKTLSITLKVNTFVREDTGGTI